MRTLTVPPAVQRDDNATQMISTWIAERRLHCSLNIGVWDADGRNEPRAWGILLADVVRHVTNAMEESWGIRLESVMAEIVQAFNAELETPTSAATGGFWPGHS